MYATYCFRLNVFERLLWDRCVGIQDSGCRTADSVNVMARIS